MRDDGFALAIGAVVTTVYVLGACPTIYVGDSGELVTAVALLGIPHPTGYPLYVLLGKLWTLALPVGSIAWRMSVFSAVFGGLTCTLLYRLGRRLALGRPAATVAALLLAVAPSFWAEATVQRVYTLNAAFVVAATTLALRWRERRDGWSLAAAFFCCGLGATNHAFLAVYAIALAIVVVVTDPSTLRARRGAGALAAFVVGLLPYVYLPLRSRADPALDWGNPETAGAFLDVVLRRNFWHRAWLEGPRDVVPIAGDYLAAVPAELGWAGAALAAIGVAAAFRRRWPVLLIALVLVVNLTSVALHGSRHDIFAWHRYYIPSYALLALLAGLGCEQLMRWLPARAAWLPLALPLLLLVGRWSEHDRSRYRIAEAFAATLLDSLPRGAHLSATDDNVLFALMYLHLVEGRRPDVELVLQGVGGAGPPPLRFDPDRDGLFFTHHPNWRLPALAVAPVGLAFQVQRRGRPLPASLVAIDTLAGEDDPRVPKDGLTRSLVAHFHYMLGFTWAARDWPRAQRELARAAAAAPDDDVLFYNLGLLYRQHGRLDDAAAAFARAHAINPRGLPSRDRPRAADRLAEIEAARRAAPGASTAN